MTEDLCSLPELGGVYYVVDKQTGRAVARFRPHQSLYHPPNEEALIQDSTGALWLVGYSNDGRKYKVRIL